MKRNEMLKLNQLGILIITYNQLQRLKLTIPAAKKLTENILVVDSYSSDGSREFLKEQSIRVEQKVFKGYSEQKNFGLEKMEAEWVLILDSDESINDALKNEIEAFIINPEEKELGVFERLNYVGQKSLKFGGFLPDQQERLFKNSLKLRYDEKKRVHETLEGTKHLKKHYFKSRLDHFSFENLEEYRAKQLKYSRLYEGKSYMLPYSLLRALFEFIRRYIFKLGFLDGFIGFWVQVYYAEYVVKKGWK